MSRAERWWRPSPRRNVRPARVGLRGRRLYTQQESDALFDVGYAAGYADGLERLRERDEQIRRLAEACEQGPDAVEALAREVGVMPADDAEQLVDELERWLREQ